MDASDDAALAPPPGQTSNFIDPPNDNARAYFAFVFSMVLVLSSVSIRVYTKVFCLKKISYQDGMQISFH